MTYEQLFCALLCLMEKNDLGLSAQPRSQDPLSFLGKVPRLLQIKEN